MMRRGLALPIVLLLLLIPITGCPNGDGPAGPSSSGSGTGTGTNGTAGGGERDPDEAAIHAFYARAKVVEKEKGLRGVLDLIAPEDRDVFVLVIVVRAGLVATSVEDAETKTALADILHAHSRAEIAKGDVDPNSNDSLRAFAPRWLKGCNREALLGDLADYMEKHQSQGPFGPSATVDGALVVLVNDGTRATARVGNQTVKFAKSDGEWYLSLRED